jgi:uncharacterized protein YecE (DUF72 family)
MVRIGTSGWVYPHWRGIFYPAGMRPDEALAEYAGSFDTVEVNNSFYRLPSEAVFESWREQTPPGFCFAVKASRFLTHLKKLKDPAEPLERFFTHALRLEEKLGPVLYQLPPHWHVNLDRFQAFLAQLPRGYIHVVEFRDPSWLVEPVFQEMERAGVAHCIHDMPLRDWQGTGNVQVPPRITSRVVYLRFHGDAQHGGDYPLAVLETWVGRIRSWQQQGLDVYVYFNNDGGGYAIQNARTVREQALKYLL